MDDGSLMRLDQLFPRLDLLAAPTRLLLSELLATPATPPALLAQEIAGLSLPRPVTDEVGQAVRTVIEDGLGADVLASVRPLRLSELVPPIRTCVGGPVDRGCPVRLGEVLRRQAKTTWVALAPLTLEEMATWTNVGPRTLAWLIGLAAAAALGPLAYDGPEPPRAEPEPVSLALLLRHERSAGGHTLRMALQDLTEKDGPAEVRAAATRLLAAADRTVDPRLALLDRAWIAAGDHRDRGVLVHRSLRLGRRTPTKELAGALGISANRIAQIQARAEQGARDGAGTPLAILAADLRSRLGDVCPLTAVDGALDDLALPGHDDPRAALLVWLAGPYRAIDGHAGWVAIDPASVLEDSRRLLHEDGGVRRLDDVAADLEAAGLAAHDVGHWLDEQPVVVFDGLAIVLSGSPVDVAERLLSATGRAMTAAELAVMKPGPGPSMVLDGRLRRDTRFLRVDRDHFELAEWGSEPFAESLPPAPAKVFPAAGAGRVGVATGRSRLRIEVDAAVLRGGAESVPLAVVEALGVPSGGRRTFTTRFGPVALSHASPQPTRGSVRPVALAAGARAGDALVLDFDATTGDASVEVVLASSSAAS